MVRGKWNINLFEWGEVVRMIVYEGVKVGVGGKGSGNFEIKEGVLWFGYYGSGVVDVIEGIRSN